MVKSPIAIMRIHWKKFIFITPITAGTVWYVYDYTVTDSIMRSACRQAAARGDERLAFFNVHPRHVTVILNPTANKRKSKKLYNKWVEPILHLAGMKVSLIETEQPDQARDLMKIMTDCDGVAIVGGDGTIREALDGFVDRQDVSNDEQPQGNQMEPLNYFPIGIIPAGKSNTFAKELNSSLVYRNQKEFLILSTMKFIDHCRASFAAKEAAKSAQELEASKRKPLSYRDKVAIGTVIVLVTAASLAFGIDSTGSQ